MKLLDEIKHLRMELDEKEKEYLDITSPCSNEKCSFYRDKQTGNCSWSVLLEDCRDYES